ncbi:hypothetical protein [Ekhidna sp. To15]|uniref:hypothetical protein n=1 Tax=Ekhidna sp. To15 TaxID=3395267 RepID=UPI003F51EFE9
MKKYLLITVFSFASTLAFSQMGSIGFSLGLPQNDFKENTDATGFGGDLSIAFPFQKGTPIYLGLDINYMVYGRNTQDLDLSANVSDQNGNVLATLDVPLRLVNTNSIFGTHAFVRGVISLEMIQPYGEVLFGFRYISTSTKITDRSNDRRWAKDPNDSDLISRETVLDDWILSYGFGGGFLIKIAPKAFIDLRVNYFKGQRAEYFDGDDTESWTVSFSDITNVATNDIDGDNLNLESQPRQSTTDLLVIKFGVAFKI